MHMQTLMNSKLLGSTGSRIRLQAVQGALFKDLILNRFYTHSLAELPQAHKGVMELPE